MNNFHQDDSPGFSLQWDCELELKTFTDYCDKVNVFMCQEHGFRERWAAGKCELWTVNLLYSYDGSSEYIRARPTLEIE